MTKGKTHLDGTKRCRIESGLREGESGKAIARAIDMHVSSVTREIRKHACESFKGCYGRANQCVRRQECRLTQVCGDCTARGARCAVCSFRNCNRFCGRVEYIGCPKRLLRTAQVCNGCPDEKSCHRRKLFYVAKRAQEDRTPFEVFEFLYGEGTAAKLHITKIDPKEMILKPRLVGIEMK